MLTLSNACIISLDPYKRSESPVKTTLCIHIQGGTSGSMLYDRSSFLAAMGKSSSRQSYKKSVDNKTRISDTYCNHAFNGKPRILQLES